MTYFLQHTGRFAHLHKMDTQSPGVSSAPAAEGNSCTSRVLQPKAPNIVQQQAGSIISNKVASQPLQSGSGLRTTHAAVTAECQPATSGPDIQCVTEAEAPVTSDGLHQAQHLSIPGQVETHQHASAVPQDARRSCSDRPAGAASALGCNVEHLADVSEQAGSKPSEGTLNKWQTNAMT